MQKYIALLFLFVVGMANICHTNEMSSDSLVPKLKPEKVPNEVEKIINEVLAGQHTLSFFESSKVGLGFDSTTKLSDLKAGKPFMIYMIRGDSLEKLGENTPVSRIAQRMRAWGVPVYVNGTCVTSFEVIMPRKYKKWGAGVFDGCSDVWQKLFEAWPDSEGYNPVLVYIGFDRYFHIPEIDDYNLTPLYRYEYDSRPADPSYKKLTHSRLTLKYEKDHLSPRIKGGVK